MAIINSGRISEICSLSRLYAGTHHFGLIRLIINEITRERYVGNGLDGDVHARRKMTEEEGGQQVLK